MKQWVSLLVLTGVVAACEASPTNTTEPGRVVASIQGSVESSYEGTGQFTFGQNLRAPRRPAIFSLRSRGTAGSGESFYLHRLGAEVPQPGSYPLAASGGFTASYERVRDRKRELFNGQSGEVVITSASPDRVEGNFRMTAALSCSGTSAAMQCSVPIPQDAPRIEVAGSFTAVRGR